MTTREEWDFSPDHQVALAALLRAGPLKDAIDVLVYGGMPKAVTGLKAGDMNANAMINTRREGFYEFYRALTALARPLPESNHAPVVRPWEYLGRPESTTPQPEQAQSKKKTRRKASLHP